MQVNPLPKVKRIGGIIVDLSFSWIRIQYTDIAGELQELEMPIGDGMYLLSLLKGAQLDLDFPFPDDPRDPNSPVIKPSQRAKNKL